MTDFNPKALASKWWTSGKQLPVRRQEPPASLEALLRQVHEHGRSQSGTSDTLLDQTQAKLEEITRDKHRLEQEAIRLKREIERLARRVEQLEPQDTTGLVTTLQRLEILQLIDRFGGIDGVHHKQWVLDQIVRLLAGDDYGAWVQKRRDDDYDWSEGIAP